MLINNSVTIQKNSNPNAIIFGKGKTLIKPSTSFCGLTSLKIDTGIFTGLINKNLDKQAISYLRTGNIDDYNSLRAKNPEYNPNLNDINFQQAYLYKTNFDGAVMIRAQLQKSNLQDSSFKMTNLNEADLSGANLCGVNLTLAKIKQTNFNEANLDGVIINLASLKQTTPNTIDYIRQNYNLIILNAIENVLLVPKSANTIII